MLLVFFNMKIWKKTATLVLSYITFFDMQNCILKSRFLMIAIPTNIHSGIRPRNVLKYQFCNVKILLLNTLQLSFVRRSNNSERIMLQSDIVIILDLSWTKFFQPSAFALEKHDTLDDDVRRDRHIFLEWNTNSNLDIMNLDIVNFAI